MKKVLLLTVIMVFSASMASAQLGQLVVSADPLGADCNIVDGAPGLLKIWVVHTLGVGIAGSEFSAPAPSCMIGATYLSDGDQAGAAVGDTQTGLSIGYGACSASPVAVVSMSFFGAGLSAPCCQYPILPHPITGLIIFNDCIPVDLPGQAGPPATINGDDAVCPCAVPTEESTWGAVKSLFNTQ
jgi:hypothetical protein